MIAHGHQIERNVKKSKQKQVFMCDGSLKL